MKKMITLEDLKEFAENSKAGAEANLYAKELAEAMGEPDWDGDMERFDAKFKARRAN